MKYILTYIKQICFFCILSHVTYSVVFADIINIKGKEPPVAKERIFQNRSILMCGSDRKTATVFTYVDVKALLAISNHFSSKQIPLTTDWQNLNTPKINLDKISSTIPKDVLRVLFICLNWQDATLGNLYIVEDEKLNSDLQKIKEEKPWKIYSKELQDQIEQLSDDQLKEFIYMVLRAEKSEEAQGPLVNNTSVKLVRYMWLL